MEYEMKSFLRNFVFLLVSAFVFPVYAESVRYSCSSCGEMTGLWWERKRLVDGWWYREPNLKLCPLCAKKPMCVSCGRAADCNHGDGRWFCRKCYDQKVFDQEEGKKIFEATRKFLKDNFGKHTSHKIYFSLEDKEYMDQISTNYAPRAIGYWSPLGSGGKIRYTSGVEYDRPKVFRIRVLSGLSPVYLASVIAHELTHDWAWEHLGELQKYEQLNEGLARYVEWLYLKAQGENKMAMEHVENVPDLVYGAGFRKIHAALNGKKDISAQLPIIKNIK